MPFSAVIPTAVQENICGVCEQTGYIVKYIECKSLDSSSAILYVCLNCNVIYNSTAELQAMDVLEWQTRWSHDPDFYKVPEGKDFANIVSQHNNTFNFFQDDLDRKFSGTYLEIGAGNGIMAAAALNYFDTAYVFDHVTDRLERTQKMIGADKYIILNAEDLAKLKVDAIVIWHALEHFLTPGKIMKMCSKILNPNGIICVQVPVLSYEHVYPGHYYFYNEIAMTEIAKNSNLRIVKFYYDHVINVMTCVFQSNS